jgi:hypothetical protein
LKHAGIEQSGMHTAGFPINKLAAILGRDPAELESIAYSKKSSIRSFCLLGEPVGSSLVYSPLRLTKPEFCPHCVRENGHIDAFWDLSIAVACPIHRTQALKECDCCGRGLTWFRPGLMSCKCGQSFDEIPLLDANPTVVSLMKIVFAKLHHLSLPANLEGNLPTDFLWRLSLQSLIEVIAALGKYSSKGTTASADLVTLAVEVLEDWPNGYHAFLRRLDGEKTGTQSSQASSLRKSFLSFYTSMFKDRKNARHFLFLRDELIRFGLTEWGKGVVDPRMTSQLSTEQRYVSKKQLADRLNIDERTLVSWAKQGKIELKSIAIDRGIRYVGDLNSVPIPIHSEGEVFRIRSAAKFLGLPVSVLTPLKKSGHYNVKHFPAFKTGYHQQDLINFKQCLLNRCKLVSLDSIPSDARTLDYVLQEVRFKAEDAKCQFIISYLSGDIHSIGRMDDSIGSILFSQLTIEQFRTHYRHSDKSLPITQTRAAELIGCDCAGVSGLISAGFLANPDPESGKVGVTHESIDAFLSAYVSLISIARRLNASVRGLKNICTDIGVEIINVPKAHNLSLAIVSIDHEKEIVDRFEIEHTEQKRSPIDALMQYFQQLRVDRLPLPRRGLKPNKVAIAENCGFDRSAFSKNHHVMDLLEQFDIEDATRHGISLMATPEDILKSYLSQLETKGIAIPVSGKKPNKLAIAEACGFNRKIFYLNKEMDSILREYVNPNPQPIMG